MFSAGTGTKMDGTYQYLGENAGIPLLTETASAESATDAHEDAGPEAPTMPADENNSGFQVALPAGTGTDTTVTSPSTLKYFAPQSTDLADTTGDRLRDLYRQYKVRPRSPMYIEGLSDFYEEAAEMWDEHEGHFFRLALEGHPIAVIYIQRNGYLLTSVPTDSSSHRMIIENSDSPFVRAAMVDFLVGEIKHLLKRIEQKAKETRTHGDIFHELLERELKGVTAVRKGHRTEIEKLQELVNSAVKFLMSFLDADISNELKAFLIKRLCELEDSYPGILGRAEPGADIVQIKKQRATDDDSNEVLFSNAAVELSVRKYFEKLGSPYGIAYPEVSPIEVAVGVVNMLFGVWTTAYPSSPDDSLLLSAELFDKGYLFTSHFKVKNIARVYKEMLEFKREGTEKSEKITELILQKLIKPLGEMVKATSGRSLSYNDLAHRRYDNKSFFAAYVNEMWPNHKYDEEEEHDVTLFARSDLDLFQQALQPTADGLSALHSMMAQAQQYASPTLVKAIGAVADRTQRKEAMDMLEIFLYELAGTNRTEMFKATFDILVHLALTSNTVGGRALEILENARSIEPIAIGLKYVNWRSEEKID